MFTWLTDSVEKTRILVNIEAIQCIKKHNEGSCIYYISSELETGKWKFDIVEETPEKIAEIISYPHRLIGMKK